MRSFTCFCLLLFATTSIRVQAAPAPKHKDATPAIIDAGCEKNIAWILERFVSCGRIGVHQNEKVAGLDIIRRQKDLESWLKKNLRLERVKGSNHVQISFHDGSPREQAAIINAVVDFYLGNDVKSRRDSSMRTVKILRDTLDNPRRHGKMTAEQLAEMEKSINKREEYIRTLPTLLKYAKSR